MRAALVSGKAFQKGAAILGTQLTLALKKLIWWHPIALAPKES